MSRPFSPCPSNTAARVREGRNWKIRDVSWLSQFGLPAFSPCNEHVPISSLRVLALLLGSRLATSAARRSCSEAFSSLAGAVCGLVKAEVAIREVRLPPLQLTCPDAFLFVIGPDGAAATLDKGRICGRCCLPPLSIDGFATSTAATPLGDIKLSLRLLSFRNVETKLRGSVFLLDVDFASNSGLSFTTIGGEEKPGAWNLPHLLGVMVSPTSA
mmetsp:Transcript_43175/g.68257  ORF Transcript_43175/g.68257 Transcript_43175/m.68257 type:complete len:214 (+) Transcript_43175:746-1387(+)